jgi:hypothetical protein
MFMLVLMLVRVLMCVLFSLIMGMLMSVGMLVLMFVFTGNVSRPMLMLVWRHRFFVLFRVLMLAMQLIFMHIYHHVLI